MCWCVHIANTPSLWLLAALKCIGNRSRNVFHCCSVIVKAPSGHRPFAIFLKPFHFYLSVYLAAACLTSWSSTPTDSQSLSQSAAQLVIQSVRPEEKAITHFKIHQAAVKNFAPKGSLFLACAPSPAPHAARYKSHMPLSAITEIEDIYKFAAGFHFLLFLISVSPFLPFTLCFFSSSFHFQLLWPCVRSYVRATPHPPCRNAFMVMSSHYKHQQRQQQQLPHQPQQKQQVRQQKRQKAKKHFDMTPFSETPKLSQRVVRYVWFAGHLRDI